MTDINKRDVLLLSDVRPIWNTFFGRSFDHMGDDDRYSAVTVAERFNYKYYAEHSGGVTGIPQPGEDYGEEFVVSSYADLPDGPKQPDHVDDVHFSERYFGEGYVYKSHQDWRDNWCTKFNDGVIEARQAEKYWLVFKGETCIYEAKPIFWDGAKNYSMAQQRDANVRVEDLKQVEPTTGEVGDVMEGVLKLLREHPERKRALTELNNVRFWTATNTPQRMKALNKAVGNFPALSDYVDGLIPPLLYRSSPDLTKVVQVEMLVAGDIAQPERWLKTVNAYLDKEAEKGKGARARFRMPQQ